MKKILVTGATGYIGSHLVKALSETGLYKVYGTDFNLNQNDIDQFVEVPVLRYDVRDGDMEDVCYDSERFAPYAENVYDVVIHLAAKTSVAPSVDQPYLYMNTNIIGTQNVIHNFCTDDTHFIYCSTGVAEHASSSPYALSKHGGEMLARMHPNFSICRFYNVSGNAGFHKYDNEYRNLIRRLAATVLGQFESFPICGTNYMTADGTAVRHYTHVMDIVNAIVRLTEFGPTQKMHFFGSQHASSVRQVVQTMEKVAKCKIKTSESLARKGDISISSYPTQRNEKNSFFQETFTLEQQCESALIAEKYYLDNIYKK
jgi:UDP-glucose 4-epimerase